MSWEERVARAEAYHLQQLTKGEVISGSGDIDARNARYEAKGNNVLDQFKVRELLEDIAPKWGEGATVDAFEGLTLSRDGQHVKAMGLFSRPVPVLRYVVGGFRGTEEALVLERQSAGLVVEVGHLSDVETPTISVHDGLLLDLREEDLHLPFPEMYLRHYGIGFNQLVRAALTEQGREVKLHTKDVHTRDKGARDMLNGIAVYHQRYRDALQSSPDQIETWVEGIIPHLPEAVRENYEAGGYYGRTFIQRTDLEGWEKSLKRTKPIMLSPSIPPGVFGVFSRFRPSA